jgi:hypothetical protein
MQLMTNFQDFIYAILLFSREILVACCQEYSSGTQIGFKASELIFTHHFHRISIFTSAQISKHEQERDLSEIMNVIVEEVAKRIAISNFWFCIFAAVKFVNTLSTLILSIS